MLIENIKCKNLIVIGNRLSIFVVMKFDVIASAFYLPTIAYNY